MIAGVVDHMHQHCSGTHGAAFPRHKRELDESIQRCLALPGAPVAVPVIDLLLCQAQISEFGMQQIM
ncbi:hypothetical protein RU10_20445 [Pseudomonas fluorescens]|uniref:Uncharacterized protein n=1 Tax=Pseudomonas fluorescens TaxID=294 RepID=A0AAE2AS74_PSEFL|nr:hypothetical protein RU10_20445 [Pseudomonas fluorescens]